MPIPARLRWTRDWTHTRYGFDLDCPAVPILSGTYMGSNRREAEASLAEVNARRRERSLPEFEILNWSPLPRRL